MPWLKSKRLPGFKVFYLKERLFLLKEQVANFFEVTTRTIENYLEQHAAELTKTVMRY